jgi:hypothetical protein
VSKLIERGGFDKVNAALADPPVSTEQIIHPEKYLDLPRDEPIAVTLPPLTSTLGTGWKHTDDGTFGELDVQILLSDNGADSSSGTPQPQPENRNSNGALSTPTATLSKEAAAGWGGGHYSIYQKDDDALVIVGTTWDSEEEADEFEATLLQTFEDAKKTGDVWQDNGRFCGVKRTGDMIVLVSATTAELVTAALDQVK